MKLTQPLLQLLSFACQSENVIRFNVRGGTFDLCLKK